MIRRQQPSNTVVWLTCVGFMLAFAASDTVEAEKFAVIVVAESIDDSDIADDTPEAFAFWNGGVLAYETMLENGFHRDNIIVIYSDGQDFSGSHDAIVERSLDLGYSMTDMKATSETVAAVLECLSIGETDSPVGCSGIPQLTDKDFLILFWTGHGFDPTLDFDPPEGCELSGDVAFRVESSVDLCASQLASRMINMKYRRRAFVFTTCRSGGIVPHFEPLGSNSVIVPACFAAEDVDSGFADDLVGISRVFWHELPHPDGTTMPGFDWTHWVDYAMRELRPAAVMSDPDNDSNSLVSVGEADTWARARADDTFDWPLSPVPPEIVDPNQIADCLFLRADEPGDDFQVFSRDHLHDDSTIPSNTEPWYHGPDLWVSNDPYGATGAEDPLFGETNYVYARVHNIGCEDLSGVTVKLSWSYPSGWMDQASWTPIGSAGPVSIVKGSSVTLPPVEWTNVPLPGNYCLHSKIFHPNDLPNGDGRAYNDNNKVQVNISVLGTVPGSLSPAFFFIENPTEESEIIDLVFDLSTIPEGVGLQIELPPDADFLGLSGAVSAVTADGWTVLDLTAASLGRLPNPTNRTARVSGLRMPAASRIRALLSIGVPHNPWPIQRVAFTFKEQVQNQDVGGIRFVLNVTDNAQTLLCEISRTEARVFRRLGARLEQRVFDDLAGRIEQQRPFVCGTLAAVQESLIAAEDERALLIGSLTNASGVFGRRFEEADQRLRNAVESGEAASAISAAQARLMYAAIVLSELEQGP